MERIPLGHPAQHHRPSTPQESSYSAASQPLQRFRLTHWQALGVVPAELPGATIARGYRLAYGRDPARDPERHATRAYSRSELEAALAALERCKPRQAPPPPPADPLKLLWAGALARLQLPSTRMFLSKEGRLLELRESTYPGRGPGELVARVTVPSGWRELVASRIHLIGNALGEVLGRVVAVELVEADR